MSAYAFTEMREAGLAAGYQNPHFVGMGFKGETSVGYVVGNSLYKVLTGPGCIKLDANTWFSSQNQRAHELPLAIDAAVRQFAESTQGPDADKHCTITKFVRDDSDDDDDDVPITPSTVGSTCTVDTSKIVYSAPKARKPATPKAPKVAPEFKPADDVPELTNTENYLKWLSAKRRSVEKESEEYATLTGEIKRTKAKITLLKSEDTGETKVVIEPRKYTGPKPPSKAGSPGKRLEAAAKHFAATGRHSAKAKKEVRETGKIKLSDFPDPVQPKRKRADAEGSKAKRAKTKNLAELPAENDLSDFQSDDEGDNTPPPSGQLASRPSSPAAGPAE